MTRADELPADDAFALDALAGLLDDAERRDFDARSAAGDVAATAAFAAWEPVLAAFADSALPLPPTDRQRAALLAAARDVPPAIPRGLLVKLADDGDFRPTRWPGVSARLLHRDPLAGQFTALLRLEPGARYPAHHHDGPEECIVLQGEVRVGDLALRAGDYQRAAPGSDHVEQWSAAGALLFITGPAALLR